MRMCVLLFFSIQILSAQKVVKKSIVDPEIEAISIDVGNCYEVMVETVANDELVVEATIDGEYKKDLVLSAKQEGRTIRVGTGFQPLFKNPSDKLSAHKVISIALKISVPEHKNVRIYGNSCNVLVAGGYRNLKITLNDGQCILENISESATVMTQSGDISVRTKGARIKASSKYGRVQSDKVPITDDIYNLTTITGNIIINKTN